MAKELILKLSNPKSSTFGLLSSQAVVDFNVGSEEVPDAFKRGTWKTVTQYVYVNMFKKESLRQRMSERLSPDPFLNMVQLREQDDVAIYNRKIFKGLYERFQQNDELRLRLYQTRGSQLVYDNKDILALLNGLRSQNQDVIYDPKTNQEIPRSEVLQVIGGVEDKILKDPFLADDLDYMMLRKYAKRRGYKDLPRNDEIFLNINHIVPILKNRMKDHLLNQDIEKFKVHLLDVFLDDILEEYYPNIHPSLYTEAKRQQIIKEKQVEVYKNQLYDLYVKGGNQYAHIFAKLKFTPDYLIQELERSFDEVEEKLLLPEAAETNLIYLQSDDPFLPHYMEDVFIDNRRYASVVHYAYAQMIENLREIGERPGIETFDINMVPLEDLADVYSELRNDWIGYNLKVNNEIATGMKFDQNPTLIHLLLATGQSQIVWNDKTDPVLGVGRDGHGSNFNGGLLEYLREMYRSKEIPDRLISSYDNIADNLWTKMWMMNVAEDYKNTMLLLKHPTTKDLETIYDFETTVKHPISDIDKEQLLAAGLTEEQITIAFPLILTLYIKMRDFTESELFKQKAEKYFATFTTGSRRRRPKNDPSAIVDQLEKLSKKFVLADGVDPERFAVSILSKKPTSDIKEVISSRVSRWTSN